MKQIFRSTLVTQGKTKIIFFALIFLYFILVPVSFVFAATSCAPLEIVYPSIPGANTPQSVTTQCLPEYVNYIFRFSIIVVGILVLGTLTYHGVRYLTSFGEPSKMTDARSGMLSALLGTVILLSSYLIFNTINPQLVSLGEPEIKTITRPLAQPGLYLCNYKVEGIKIGNEMIGIDAIMTNYINPDPATRKKGAEQLSAIMNYSEDQTCWKVSGSGNLRNFKIEEGKDNYTLFVIPTERYFPSIKDYGWEYNYAAVLHEKKSFSGSGKCELWPHPQGGYVYRYQPTDPRYQTTQYVYHPSLKFTARSITVFQNPTVEPLSSDQGAIFYECLSYNAKCPKSTTTSPKKQGFRPDQTPNIRDVGYIDSALFRREGFEVDSNGRFKFQSIEMEPMGKYFALLFEDDDQTKRDGKCQIIKGSISDMSKLPISKCTGCWWGCELCVRSAYVIKGEIL